MKRYALRIIASLLGGGLAWGCAIPEAVPAVGRDAERLFFLGRYAQALTGLEAQKESGEPAAKAQHEYMLARAHLGMGEFEEALSAVEKALALEPGNASFHVELAAVTGRMAERAGVFKQLGLARRVKKELDAALALEPHNTDALWGLILFSWDAPSFVGGDHAKAEKFLADLDGLDPVRGALAHAALAHERKDAAAEEVFLRRAVAAASPARTAVAYEAHAAYAAFALKAWPEMTEVAREQACLALGLEPGRSEAWEVQAELAAMAECWREMDEILLAAARFVPGNLSPEFHAASGIIAVGKRLDAAQAILLRYLQTHPQGDEPSLGRAHFKLALIFEKRGRPNEAAAMLRESIHEDPTLDDARRELKHLGAGQ